MSPEQGCLVSAHEERESSEAGSSKNQLIPRGPKITREPPQNIETTTDGEMSGILEVTEPPQIDPTTAWRMFINGAKNSLGVGARIVLKSLEGTIFE